jgi:glucose dehydrogenase
MAAGDPSNQRFIDLDQIDASNVSKLKLAWTFSTGVLRGHEAAPLVVGGRMTSSRRIPTTSMRSI